MLIYPVWANSGKHAVATFPVEAPPAGQNGGASGSPAATMSSDGKLEELTFILGPQPLTAEKKRVMHAMSQRNNRASE